MIFIFIIVYYLWEWTSAYKWMIDSFAVCQRQQTAHKGFGIDIDAKICRQRRMKRLCYFYFSVGEKYLQTKKEYWMKRLISDLQVNLSAGKDGDRYDVP